MKFRLILFTLIAAVVFSGCGTRNAENNEAAYDSTIEYGDSFYFVDAVAEEAGAVEFAGDYSTNSYAKAMPASASGTFGSTESAQPRMVQKSASITITVADPVNSQKQIVELTEAMGGFVVSSSVSQEYYSNNIYLPKAYLTIRVPAERLNEMLESIENQTEDPSRDVRNKTISGVDITSEFVDTNSRLASLEKTLTKLYEILDTAETAEETMLVYNDISNTEQEIEVLKGQINYMQESVALSSINVTINSVRPAPSVTVRKWQPGETVKDAFEALLETGKDVITGIIYFVIVGIPVLLIIAIPVVLIILLIKTIRKSIRSKKESRKESVKAEHESK